MSRKNKTKSSKPTSIQAIIAAAAAEGEAIIAAQKAAEEAERLKKETVANALAKSRIPEYEAWLLEELPRIVREYTALGRRIYDIGDNPVLAGVCERAGLSVKMQWVNTGPYSEIWQEGYHCYYIEW